MTDARLTPQMLDDLTGGAFSAATSGERASRIREWLATEPTLELMQEVFRELSVKDKGAVKPLREKLDDIKRARNQDTIGAEWAAKGQALLDLGRLNVADAMAWQRDAAKAGAPLSREPLAGLKNLLIERVKVIEDLQHHVQVQREAAVLLAQRIETLSTKPWREAQAAAEQLQQDVQHWQGQATSLQEDANWASVDVRFAPQLDASRSHLQLVWDAFSSALSATSSAAEDARAPLPSVPVWADEIRALRGLPAADAPKPAKVPKEPKAPKEPKELVDPETQAQATAAVQEALSKLEQEMSQGHGKASASAATALRQVLKTHARVIDDALEHQAQTALAAEGELESWQRWRADQLRQELIQKAEGLLKRPAGQALGGRKLQETLRQLREQWKQTDQGGVPNHSLWKRFDEACNEAYKQVQAWVDKIKTEAAEHKAQRAALLAELQTWAAENPTAKDEDWKGFARVLQQFNDRWRNAGHLGEKAFAEMQGQWKDAMTQAQAPLVALQQTSLAQRQALIEQAKVLGAAPVLRVDAIKALQQSWQAEAHRVPLDRRQEQKLWDAFRQPLDEAFNRKTAEREKAAGSVSAFDKRVLEAAKALEQANASGHAQTIRAAMQALDDALHARADAASNQPADQQAIASVAPEVVAPATQAQDAAVEPSSEEAASSATAEADTAAAEPVAQAQPAPAPRKPVVAVRGDDRPGQKRTEPAPAGRGARPGRPERDNRGGPEQRGRPGERWGDRDGRDGRGGAEGRGARTFDTPRLGDAAFRAQRNAMEQAQLALKKLAAQAHGEVLTHLMQAWQQRDPAQLPAAQELGPRVSTGVRGLWVQALSSPAKAADEALLRLELAAEVPTPAEQLDARRALQLQLLTRRNDPPPAQTWGQDVARVLHASWNETEARRLQNVLKQLLRR
jgi:ATP-dependent RNA helicase SUPV3L1/SUV3